MRSWRPPCRAYLSACVRFFCQTWRMRASRLLSVLLLLQNRGRMTAEELAAELEVSVRTVYRDIDALSASGVPVYADRGRTGGHRLGAGHPPRRRRLSGDG